MVLTTDLEQVLVGILQERGPPPDLGPTRRANFGFDLGPPNWSRLTGIGQAAGTKNPSR